MKLRLAFTFAIIWELLLYFRLPGFVWDDAFVMSWFVGHGLKFYVDFSGGAYFPLLKLLMIPIGAIFGWNVQLTLVLGLLLVFGVLITLYVFSVRYLPAKSKHIPLLFITLWFGFILRQNTFEINLYLGLLSLWAIFLFYDWISKRSKSHIFFIGLVSSFAIFSEQLSAVSFAALFMLVIVFCIFQNISLKKVLNTVIIPYLLGFILIPIPMIVWFYSQGLIHEFIFANILYYFIPNGYPFSHYFSQNDILILSVLNIPLFLCLIRTLTTPKVISRIKKGDKILWLDITIIVFLVSAIVVTLLAVLHPRRYLIILPTLSFLAGTEYEYLKSQKARLYQLAKVALGIVFLLYLFTNILPWYKNAISTGRQYEIYNLHHPGDNAYEAIQWIKKNTPSDTKIVSFETTIAYFEADRLPAMNRTYILPWTFEPFEETKIALEKNKAPYWLVSELMFNRFTQLGYGYQADFLRSYLDKYYTKIQSFGWASIYAKKSR